MGIRKFSVAVVSDGAGAATVFSGRLSGYLRSIQYLKTDYTDGIDFTITAEATGQTIWTQVDVNAAVIKHPRAPTNAIDGTASLRVAADAASAVNDLIALGADRVKIVLAQAGATKTGTFVITMDDGGRYGS
jgi:hypothetical protein